MKESVLLETKPLVDSIRHFIWDPSGRSANSQEHFITIVDVKLGGQNLQNLGNKLWGIGEKRLSDNTFSASLVSSKSRFCLRTGTERALCHTSTHILPGIRMRRLRCPSSRHCEKEWKRKPNKWKWNLFFRCYTDHNRLYRLSNLARGL